MVSDQVQHKPSCTCTKEGQNLEILDLKSRGNCTDRIMETKAAITAKLICSFVFSYADCLFSREAAQILVGVANGLATLWT